MNNPASDEKKTDIKLIQLLPNLLTVSAICAGLTAIRFGFEGNFEMAVRLVLVACVLDGLDGRLARLMNSESAVGAELDSLADFLNFGVAPVLILYSWTLHDLRGSGWLAVLIYAICCVLRLARFNVQSRMDSDNKSADFFIGVPSPAGAILVLFPMVLSFALSDMPVLPPLVTAIYTGLVGMLMISHLPTYSFKNIIVDRANAKFILLGTCILAAALLTYLWAMMTLLTLAYIGCLVWAYRSSRKSDTPEG